MQPAIGGVGWPLSSGTISGLPGLLAQPEFAARGTGKLLIHAPVLDKLQALRDQLGKPLIVHSAHRSPEHNRAVGGASRSKHPENAAFDIAIAYLCPVEVCIRPG